MKSIQTLPSLLVGGFNPSEKYARQIGSFPQVGVKIKNISNHHLVYHNVSELGVSLGQYALALEGVWSHGIFWLFRYDKSIV